MFNYEDGSLVLCGAKSKRTGNPCCQPAMANGRCRLHGGKCKGPITKAGLERCRLVCLKHGYYSKEQLMEKRKARSLIQEAKNTIKNIF